MERPREVEQPGPYDLPLPWGVRGRSRQKLLQVRQWALSATRQCKGTPSVTLGSLWRLTCVYRELIPSGFTVGGLRGRDHPSSRDWKRVVVPTFSPDWDAAGFLAPLLTGGTRQKLRGPAAGRARYLAARGLSFVAPLHFAANVRDRVGARGF